MDEPSYAIGWALLFDLVASVVLGICVGWSKGEKMKAFGVPAMKPDDEDCEESVVMMMDFLQDSMKDDRSRWQKECTNAGCRGSYVMKDSFDLRKLVKAAHMVGTRIVLRKKSDLDIERKENSKLEVLRVRSELDIRRAKRIEKKYRRKL